MGAYSKDLRISTLKAVERGIPRREIFEIVEIFGISLRLPSNAG